MTYDYDALYGTTPAALGDPSQVFVDFFAGLDAQRRRVLDIGCGQGRDALFIGRLGHEMVGVDLSPNGIRDLTAAAHDEGLAITALVADIRSHEPDGLFDIVLIDRTLHMLSEPDRLDVLSRLLDHVAPGGHCLIADEGANLRRFAKVAEAHRLAWEKVASPKGCLFLRRG